MIQCQQCGQTNAAESNFCRACGLRFAPPQQHQPPPPQQQQQQPVNYDYAPPRPYAWKTDEYQTNAEARKTSSGIQPTANQTPFAAPTNSALAYGQPQQMAHGYRCPHCGSNYMPIFERRISTAGWITFAVLLITTFFFFWIGLLLKEDVRVCPVCRRSVG